MILSRVKGLQGLLVVSVVPSIPFQLSLVEIPDRKLRDSTKVRPAQAARCRRVTLHAVISVVSKKRLAFQFELQHLPQFR